MQKNVLILNTVAMLQFWISFRNRWRKSVCLRTSVVKEYAWTRTSAVNIPVLPSKALVPSASEYAASVSFSSFLFPFLPDSFLISYKFFIFPFNDFFYGRAVCLIWKVRARKSVNFALNVHYFKCYTRLNLCSLAIRYT